MICVMSDHGPSYFIRLTVRVNAFIFIVSLSHALSGLAFTSLEYTCVDLTLSSLADFMSIFNRTAAAYTGWFALYLVWIKLTIFHEQYCGQPCSCTLFICFIVLLFGSVATCLGYGVGYPLPAILVFGAFRSPVSRLRYKAKMKNGLAREEAVSTAKMLNVDAWASLLTGLTAGVASIGYLLQNVKHTWHGDAASDTLALERLRNEGPESMTPFWADYWKSWDFDKLFLDVAMCLDFAVSAWSATLMAGLAKGVLRRFRSTLKALVLVCTRRIRAKPQRRVMPAGDWHLKVWELANRSITLETLLDFYAALGTDKLLPHFDPARSTTNDVVRQAVIPCSVGPEAQSGFAFADLSWLEGRAILPEAGQMGSPMSLRHFNSRLRMVTHGWDNVFRDLVAAVVADGLAEPCWGEVADKLSGTTAAQRCLGVHALKDALRARRTLQARYWICAFCVNQHASICGGFGRKPEDEVAAAAWEAKNRDTVTGLTYPLCRCKEKKYFNDTPDLCELNKFDDMMETLHRIHPDFGQVVAVGRKFHLFTRAWCVAELVQGNQSGLEQSVKIHSKDNLTQCIRSIGELKVQDCQASRPEDKHAILSKIGQEGDIDSFNETLNALVFSGSGLLSGEKDAVTNMLEAGAVLRKLGAER